ncbi:MAG: hypothetical protein R3D69_06750 [Xanthobacteraceae bacterium]
MRAPEARRCPALGGCFPPLTAERVEAGGRRAGGRRRGEGREVVDARRRGRVSPKHGIGGVVGSGRATLAGKPVALGAEHVRRQRLRRGGPAGRDRQKTDGREASEIARRVPGTTSLALLAARHVLGTPRIRQQDLPKHQ